MHTCFLKKDRKGVDLVGRGREEDLRGVGVMGNHNQDALFNMEKNQRDLKQPEYET